MAMLMTRSITPTMIPAVALPEDDGAKKIKFVNHNYYEQIMNHFSNVTYIQLTWPQPFQLLISDQ